MASDFFRINLRRLMTEKDIGVKALVAVTGVSASQISHYRSGDNAPDGERRAKIARALGVSVEDLERDPKTVQPEPRLINRK